MPKDGAFDMALKEIQKILETVGKQTTDFDLPRPSDFSWTVTENSTRIPNRAGHI